MTTVAAYRLQSCGRVIYVDHTLPTHLRIDKLKISH